MRAAKLREWLLGEVPVPAEYVESIRRMRLRRFQHLASIAAIFSLLAAILLTVIFWNQATMPVVSMWCVASGILAFLRVRDSAQAAPGSLEQLDEFEREATRHTIISGAVWGIMLASLAYSAPIQHDWFLGVLAASVVCIGAFLHSSFPRAALGYSLLITVGILIGLTLNGSSLVLESTFVFAGSLIAVQRFAAMNHANMVRRKITSNDLSESNETISLLLSDFESHSADWLWRTNAHGCIVQPSERFAEAAMLSYAKLAGAHIGALLREESAREFEALLAERRPFNDVVLEVNCADGPRWWSVSGKPTADGGHRGVCSRGCRAGCA